MSTKPTVLPRWGNVSGVVVTPSSAKQDEGWVAGEHPPAQYMTWLDLHTYNWCKYLNDGDMQGDFTFANDVAVTGDLTVTGALRLTTAWSIPIPACMAAPANTGNTFSRDYERWSGDSGTLYYPIHGLRSGDRIIAFNLYADKTSNGSHTIGVQLYKTHCTTALQTTIGTHYQTNANNPGIVTMPVIGLTETVTSAYTYMLVAEGLFGTDNFMCAEVLVDRP